MTRTFSTQYEFDENQKAYWVSVYERLELWQHGISRNAFLEDPYPYLRLAGQGLVDIDLDLLEILPAKGTA